MNETGAKDARAYKVRPVIKAGGAKCCKIFSQLPGYASPLLRATKSQNLR